MLGQSPILSLEFATSYDGDLAEDLVMVVSPRSIEALSAVAVLLEERIKAKLSHPGSGRFYWSKRFDGSRHQASAPGEPPAPDTEKYVNSWETMVESSAYFFSAYVASTLWEVFGRRLELGGSGGGAFIAPRPHVRPVWEESQDEMQTILDEM